jgi:aryl-alcohol dehydrogenase-like predicted oxidoreductase
LHELDPSTPLEETLGALDLALAAGKIAAFGVSNASAGDLRNVLALVGDGALRRAFTHVQNEFNRLHTDDLAEVIPLTRAEAIAYVAFSPLAGGLLTGKYRQGRPPDPGTRVAVAPGFYADNLGPSTFAAIDELAGQAAARGWSVPGAALRFILDTPGVDALIVAPRTLAQFEGYGIGAGRAAG